MCNFLITNILNIEKANFYQKFRGPDHEKEIIFNNILFLHNLLSITGDFYPQPYEDNDVIICFNGEIYNYLDFGNFKSDVECIAKLYKIGLDELCKLDGEFAIVVYDKKTKVFYLIHDLFAIKPLFIGIDGDKFCISTYRSASDKLGFKNIKKISPNSIYKFDGKLEKVRELYKWDLKQKKDKYDDLFDAIEKAIMKRANTNKEILVNMSSGYDSGVICCVLNKFKKKYNTATIVGKEELDVVKERMKKNNISKFALLIDKISDKEQDDLMKYIDKNTENYIIDQYYGDKIEKYNFKEDKAIIGAARIYNQVRSDDIKIVLSGSGADEIFSDYGFAGKKIYGHSGFGGAFPKKLEDIFPKNSDDRNCIWKHFYHNCQESYLWKDEVITGLYGIEGRFPFLDRKVVQEFLWLNQELKNKEYKGCLKKYLEKNNYPFTEKKIGFNI